MLGFHRRVSLGSILWILLLSHHGIATDPTDLVNNTFSEDHPSSPEDQKALLDAKKKICEIQREEERRSIYSELERTTETPVNRQESPSSRYANAIDFALHSAAANSTHTPGSSESASEDRNDQSSVAASWSPPMSVVSDTGTLYCPTFFDKIYCWPRTLANELVTIACPSYVKGFLSSNASRYCTLEGKWHNWANYTQCTPVRVDVNEVNSTLLRSTPAVRAVSYVGYSISLATLIVAFTVLACVKRLRCPRNTLHMHFFFSFICRAVGALAIDPTDLHEHPIYGHGQAHLTGTWACRLLTSLWQYSILANYAWILMEGLYLHNLIFLALFTDNSAITLYIVLGWGLPFLMVLGWVTARMTVENTLCWFTNDTPWLFWTFIRGPVSISIIVSFALFLNITRELFLKLRSSTTPESRKYRYRRWVRSALVLVPLFGVHYALLLGFSYFIDYNSTIELVWLSIDQFFASLQGFFVATLYCLLNAEVRLELLKIWQHWRMNQEQDKSINFHSAFSQSRTCFSRGTGSPGLVLTGNKKKNGSGQPTGNDPNLLSMTSKVNGGHAQSNYHKGHRRSSCDDLNNQSLTVSLAVVELQQLSDKGAKEEENRRPQTSESTASWYPAAEESTNMTDMGDLESALILHPLTHNAHDSVNTAVQPTPTGVSSADQENPRNLLEDQSSNSGLGDHPSRSSILYQAGDTYEKSPLIACAPRLAESTF